MKVINKKNTNSLDRSHLPDQILRIGADTKRGN